MGQTIICEFLADWKERGEQPDPLDYDFDGMCEMLTECQNVMIALGEAVNAKASRLTEFTRQFSITRCDTCVRMRHCHAVGDVNICNDCHVDFALSSAVALATSAANKRIAQLEAYSSTEEFIARHEARLALERRLHVQQIVLDEAHEENHRNAVKITELATALANLSTQHEAIKRQLHAALATVGAAASDNAA